MGILSVREGFDGRNAEATLEERKYVRTFYVATDSSSTTAGEVGNAPGIPRVGSPFLSGSGFLDAGVYCNRVSPRQRNEHPRQWIVEVGYTSRLDRAAGGSVGNSTPTGQGGGAGGSGAGPLDKVDNPFLRPADVRFGVNKITVPVLSHATHTFQVDLDDPPGAWTISSTPCLNTAGDPFQPPPEIDEARLTLTITRNQEKYDAVLYTDYFGSVNSETWAGFDVRRVKCNGITGDRGFEQGTYFWKVTYEFEVHPIDWDHRILNAGLNELVGGAKKAILDTTSGRPFSTPQLLSEDGTRLPVGGTPNYITYRLRLERDFNLLGLF